MSMELTPSQTIGPFFHLCLTTDADLARLAGPDAKGERIKLVCSIVDGDGAAVTDAMVEIWQADAAGKYLNGDPDFRGFGRQCTNEHGTCAFETVKPGCVPPQ